MGANADKMYNWYNNHLKKDHPEMEYIPIGPIADANGVNAMPGTVNQKGRAGDRSRSALICNIMVNPITS